MKTIKPIKTGDEIFNDYGEIPRADLLRRYGYVTDNYSQYDVVELSLTNICQAAGLPNADVESQPPVLHLIPATSSADCLQLNLLEDLELLDDGYAIPRPSPEDSAADILSDELLILLKTLTLSSQELNKQKSKSKPPKPVLGQAEAAILRKAVSLKRAEYATDLSQDRTLLADLKQPGPLEGSSRRRKMAIEVRIGEKEILDALIATLDNPAPAAANGSAKRSANGDDTESRTAKAQKV